VGQVVQSDFREAVLHDSESCLVRAELVAELGDLGNGHPTVIGENESIVL
jgi:hypothetical protein